MSRVRKALDSSDAVVSGGRCLVSEGRCLVSEGRCLVSEGRRLMVRQQSKVSGSMKTPEAEKLVRKWSKVSGQ